MDISAIHYAVVDDLRIAYQEFGSGEPAVYVPPIVSNIEVKWDHEFHRRMLEHLGASLRVLQFDKRGIGLSDRFESTPTLDERIGDVGAVMDAVGWQRAHVIGISEGADMAQLFATRFPERVDKLALLAPSGPFDDPARITELSGDAHREIGEISAEFMQVAATWGEDALAFANLLAPSQADNPAYLRWANRLNRLSASPADFVRQLMSISEIDSSTEPDAVQAPTMIIHLKGDRVRPIGNGRALAERITGSTYIEVEGDDHLVYSLDNWRDAIDPAIEFFTGIRPPRSTKRRFAAVMFTDIVGSTSIASTVGDLAWRQLLERHEHINHREVSVNRGRVVKSTGDGVLAVFETPSDAVAAAHSVRTELQHVGLSIRAGIHAGEIEAHADGDVSGLTVNIAARVEQVAPNGTIFVSSTVREMMLGGEVDLLEKGEHELKGVEGLWRLYEAP